MQFSLVGVVSRGHSPGLLLFGNDDKAASGNGPIPPAVVANLLGQPVKAQDLAQGVLGLTDDAPQLLLGVLLFVHQGLQAFGLFDAGEILPEKILHHGNFRIVAGN